ncbi:MAG TPA: hypothetical protein VKB78_16415, partial [Pirellulales bacterium]|nr:hypothetical protein [Pirellulales bacterium]
HFITSPRRLHEIRRILERRAERFGGNTITENPLEKIRSDLPWNEQGVGDLELGTGDASSSSAAD